jgi:hypothetical protein
VTDMANQCLFRTTRSSDELGDLLQAAGFRRARSGILKGYLSRDLAFVHINDPLYDGTPGTTFVVETRRPHATYGRDHPVNRFLGEAGQLSRVNLLTGEVETYFPPQQ